MIEDIMELGHYSRNAILVVVLVQPNNFRQVPKSFADEEKNKYTNTH
jgi:hypothetical protein